MEQNREKQIQDITLTWDAVNKTNFTIEVINRNEANALNMEFAVQEWTSKVALADNPTSIPLDCVKMDFSQYHASEQESKRISFRQGLIEKLVKLKAQDVALRLIQNIVDRDLQTRMHLLLIETVIANGELDTARLVINDTLKDDPDIMFIARLKIFHLQKDNRDLSDLRVLAATAASSHRFPICKETYNRMLLYQFTGDLADYLKAKKLAQNAHGVERGDCYRRIASRTGNIDDYLDAFRAYQHALTEYEESSVVTSVYRMIASLFAAISAHPNDNKNSFDGIVYYHAVVGVEAFKTLLRKLATINPLWADALKKQIGSYLNLR
ncbi:MAG: hypothetical protein ABIB04_01775 [Patescibacteria group bacterium]